MTKQDITKAVLSVHFDEEMEAIMREVHEELKDPEMRKHLEDELSEIFKKSGLTLDGEQL